MNKNEFLKTLRKKLDVLEESEIDDIINEYDGYIEEKIATGASEKDAVKSMGNIDELARDLLSAYKVKNPQEKSNSFNNIAESILNVFEQIVDMFANKSFNEIFRFVLEIIVILLIIGICKIPFEIIGGLGRDIFISVDSHVFHILSGIWNFVVDFAYLIFAVLLFVKIFDSRYLKNAPVREKNKSYNTEKVSESSNKIVKEEKKVSNVKSEKNSNSIIDTLVNVWIIFIKFIAFWILIGVMCYIIGMCAGIGVSVYFLIRGVFYFGIYLIILSLFMFGIIAFFFLFNFIFNRRNKINLLLITILISFGLFGAGVAVCAIEFANTTIIYTEDEDNNKIETFTYEMQDNLILSRSPYSIIIDDSLENTIKVEFKYNDSYVKLNPNPFIENNNKYSILNLRYELEEFRYSKVIFNDLINDLKNKTIKVNRNGYMEIKIYASSDVKKQIIKNEEEYDNRYNYYNDYDLDDICEELEDLGYEVPGYCSSYLNHHM